MKTCIVALFFALFFFAALEKGVTAKVHPDRDSKFIICGFQIQVNNSTVSVYAKDGKYIASFRTEDYFIALRAEAVLATIILDSDKDLQFYLHKRGVFESDYVNVVDRTGNMILKTTNANGSNAEAMFNAMVAVNQMAKQQEKPCKD